MPTDDSTDGSMSGRRIATAPVWGKPGNSVEAIAVWLLSSAVVWIGVSFGSEFVEAVPQKSAAVAPFGAVDAVSRWDGDWYAGIVTDGYFWNRHTHSNVAYFPGYPAAGWIISSLTGLEPRVALLLLGNTAFLLALIAAARYGRTRNAANNSDEASWLLLATAFLPFGVFFHTVSTEPLFLLLVIGFLFSIQKQSSLATIALVCGASTAVRAVGVGLILPFVWHLRTRVGSWRQFASTGLWSVPLSAWGIMAYMLFLWWKVGDPLAFAHAQDNWAQRAEPAGLERALSLVTFQPVRDVFSRESLAWWGRSGPDIPWFNWRFWNPVVFIGTCLVVLAGWRAKQITTVEFLTAFGLLGIPYVFHSHRILMQGHARFSSVVFPACIVLAGWLARMPREAAVAFTAYSAALLCLVSAMLAAGFGVF